MKLKLLMVLVVVLFACEKPASYCWECNTQKYKDYVRYGMPVYDTIMCEKTEDFVYRYEQLKTYSDNKGNGYDVVCKKVIKN